jgi:hypothetical protein
MVKFYFTIFPILPGLNLAVGREFSKVFDSGLSGVFEGWLSRGCAVRRRLLRVFELRKVLSIKEIDCDYPAAGRLGQESAVAGLVDPRLLVRLFEVLVGQYLGSLTDCFADRFREAGIHPVSGAGYLAGHNNDLYAAQISQFAKKI